jgi:hypothetical protein
MIKITILDCATNESSMRLVRLCSGTAVMFGITEVGEFRQSSHAKSAGGPLYLATEQPFIVDLLQKFTSQT